MKLKSSTGSRRLLRAAAEDGLGFIFGLPGVPIPLETIKAVIGLAKERSPLNFVDWELQNWPTIYRRHLTSLVQLPYDGKNLLLPQVLIFDNTDLKYGLSDVILSVQPTSFELPSQIRAHTEGFFKKLAGAIDYSDEENLRLNDITQESDKVTFTLQSVRYEDYLRSNLVLDAKGAGKRETLRQKVHSSGTLEDLKESPLANHLGVNILAFTADGSLIVQKRSQKVSIRRGEFCSAGSGTVSAGDFVHDTTLDRVRVLREAFDEIGIRSEDIEPESTLLLGVSRELIRGGKPEMFLSAKVKLTESDVTARWKHASERRETKKLLYYNFGRAAFEPLDSSNLVHDFLHCVDDFTEEFFERASIPLLTNVALWVQSRLNRK